MKIYDKYFLINSYFVLLLILHDAWSWSLLLNKKI